jgi:hypothetical protein
MAIQPTCRPRRAQALPSAAEPNTTAEVMMIQCRATSEPIQGVAASSTPRPIQATVPALPDAVYQRSQLLRLDRGPGEDFRFAKHAVRQRRRDGKPPGTLQQDVAHWMPCV